MGIVAPWAMFPRDILGWFAKGGVRGGLGSWGGFATVTIPAMMLFFWLGKTAFEFLAK